jgi:predicted RNA binding protein YcfA (HicA-like mRNA interferase family)
MDLPRDLSGPDLVKLLRILGYHMTRQTGGHLRLVAMLKRCRAIGRGMPG